MKRISPDTDVALRVPTLEDLPTSTPVLGQIKGNHDVVGHREPVVRELGRNGVVRDQPLAGLGTP